VPPIPAGELLVAIVILGTISIAAFYCARSRPYLVVGWLWFLGSLVPAIGLVQVGEQAMADRYTYLPLIGVFLVVVWAFADLVRKLKVRLAIVAAISAVVVGTCITITAHQLDYWRDDVALFTRATLVTSHGATSHALLADALVQRGDNEQATRHLEEALTIQPRSAKIHYECALVQGKQGKYQAAADHFAEAVQLKPDFVDAYNELGIVLSKLGRLQEATQTFTQAIEHAPRNAKAYNNRGIARSAQGDSVDALRDYQVALQINANQLGAIKNLAWLEATDKNAAIRNGADAMKLAQRACELTRFQEPHSLEILAASQAESGDFEMAIKTAQKAIDLLTATRHDETNPMFRRLLTAKDLYHVGKPFRRPE
jgi:protein O-mannosyl-transferase